MIRAVLSMLEREPDEALTIARIAREVDAAPAALYRHFECLDDLLDGVLARVLAEVEAGLDPCAPWEEQLAGWMRRLRDRLLRVPRVLALIGRSGRTSPAWLEASSVLVEILAAAGLERRELATTYLWILETTMGLVLQEAMLPLSEQLANARDSRSALSHRARARFARIRSDLDRLDGETFFSFFVEQATRNVALRRRD